MTSIGVHIQSINSNTLAPYTMFFMWHNFKQYCVNTENIIPSVTYVVFSSLYPITRKGNKSFSQMYTLIFHIDLQKYISSPYFNTFRYYGQC